MNLRTFFHFLLPNSQVQWHFSQIKICFRLFFFLRSPGHLHRSPPPQDFISFWNYKNTLYICTFENNKKMKLNKILFFITLEEYDATPTRHPSTAPASPLIKRKPKNHLDEIEKNREVLAEGVICTKTIKNLLSAHSDELRWIKRLEWLRWGL